MLVDAQLIITCVCQHQDAGHSCCVGLEPLAQQRLAVVGHHERLGSRVLRLREGLHRKERLRRQSTGGAGQVFVPCSLRADRQLGSAVRLYSSIATSRPPSTISVQKHELGRHS